VSDAIINNTDVTNFSARFRQWTTASSTTLYARQYTVVEISILHLDFEITVHCSLLHYSFHMVQKFPAADAVISHTYAADVGGRFREWTATSCSKLYAGQITTGYEKRLYV